MCLFRKIRRQGKSSCYIINENKKREKDFRVKVFVKKELVSSYNRLSFDNEVGYYARLEPINYAQTVRLERVDIDYILLMFDNKEIEDISEEKQKELKDLFEKSIEAYEEEAKTFSYREP